MTIAEAVSLVLQAFAIGGNGDISCVARHGGPVRVADLGEKLWARLSGKIPPGILRSLALRPWRKKKPLRGTLLSERAGIAQRLPPR